MLRPYSNLKKVLQVSIDRITQCTRDAKLIDVETCRMTIIENERVTKSVLRGTEKWFFGV